MKTFLILSLLTLGMLGTPSPVGAADARGTNAPVIPFVPWDGTNKVVKE